MVYVCVFCSVLYCFVRAGIYIYICLLNIYIYTVCVCVVVVGGSPAHGVCLFLF